MLIEDCGSLCTSLYVAIGWSDRVARWTNAVCVREFGCSALQSDLVAMVEAGLCEWLLDQNCPRGVFLVVDMASCHLHPSLLAVVRSQSLRMVLVPAGLTSTLQPLDSRFSIFPGQDAGVLACRRSLFEGVVAFSLQSHPDS